jgi:hypothetical protein
MGYGRSRSVPQGGLKGHLARKFFRRGARLRAILHRKKLVRKRSNALGKGDSLLQLRVCQRCGPLGKIPLMILSSANNGVNLYDIRHSLVI